MVTSSTPYCWDEERGQALTPTRLLHTAHRLLGLLHSPPGAKMPTACGSSGCITSALQPPPGHSQPRALSFPLLSLLDPRAKLSAKPCVSEPSHAKRSSLEHSFWKSTSKSCLHVGFRTVELPYLGSKYVDLPAQ